MQLQRPVRIGLVGFGAGGALFHAPYIEAAPDVELAGVVTRNPARRALLAEQFPAAPLYGSLAEMVDAERAGAGLDAVTITTPPQTRRDLVLEALARGLHVVADKPFAPNAAGAVELDEAGRRAGLVLSVYHNRRWDSDIRTIRALVQRGRLGRVRWFHSRLDLDEPSGLEGGPTGGLVRDLGSHLVDQALWLFGPVDRVFAEFEWGETAAGSTDVAFDITLSHRDGVTSRISATKLNKVDDRELRVYGELGSYAAHSIDVQVKDLQRGRRPGTDPAAWGFEPESAWGTLRTDAGAQQVPAEQGSYVDYYRRFAAAVRGEAPPPVSAAEAVAVLEVLDAARVSATEGVVVRPVRE
ncbi:MAG TPA: Gfo/Idh/MocA family oxidoreductase [Nakamurella sp.]